MPRADRTTGSRPDRRAGGSRRKPTSPPPTVIMLVRHGKTATTGAKLPGRAPGLDLDDTGRRQAEDVAARIVRITTPAPDSPAGKAAAGVPGSNGRSPRSRGRSGGRRADGQATDGVAAVYSSPLERTRQTAEAIARAVGRDVQVDDGLIELDIGEWTGMDLKDAMKRPEWTTIQRYPSGFTFPGGESFAAMQSRMVDTLARLRARHPGETVVAVSHADPIRAVVAHAMGTHLDLFQRVVVSPCSLTVLSLADTGPTVLAVNGTGDEPVVPA
ncbi:MAG TPA: histidine phosphatase family protein [Acidimicrobiales bacterium]